MNRFELVGNHPALDFVNTEVVREGERTELLTEADALADWFEQVGWQRPAVSGAQVEEARQLRQAIRGLVEAKVERQLPPPEARTLVNAVLASGGERQEIGPDFATRTVRLGNPLAQIAESVVNLLACHDAERIRACAGHGCIRWFLDTSKNGKRRWCSMAGCGNREKAAAHYQRSKP